MLDQCLDDYETLWSGSHLPPDLLEFLRQRPSAAADRHTASELALIDLEQRWRLFFRAEGNGAAQERKDAAGLPRLPTWADYCRLLSALDPNWLEGVCHEFRVRQLFGDRPSSRELAARYPEANPSLGERLPDISAQLMRANITLVEDGRPIFTCRLPGRLEIGRRRVGEPPSPGLVEAGQSRRLLVAELTFAKISRSQVELEVIAKDRLLVQHKASRGSVVCCPGPKLTQNDSCEAAVPFLLNLRGLVLRIERTGA
jgi:hypothetical protein